MVGGTGPSGRHVVGGLLERGYDVTIAHTGRHEVDEWERMVRHIHVDPYDPQAVEGALRGKSYDLCVALYGRLREVARILEGRAGRFISVGTFVAYKGVALDQPGQDRPRTPLREDSELASAVPGEGGTDPKLARIVQSEHAVFKHHPMATHLRYSLMYGPYHPSPVIEWSIVKRVLDKRKEIILPEGGLTLRSRAYTVNAAHALMCVVDNPDESQGQVYNVSDEWTPPIRQWVEIISRALGHQFDVVAMPYELATPSHPMLFVGDAGHRLTPCDKALYKLGYRDVVDVEVALAETAQWLAGHPPSTKDPINRSDPFNYSAEDELIGRWRAAVERVALAAGAADPHFVPRYSSKHRESAPGGGRWATLAPAD